MALWMVAPSRLATLPRPFVLDAMPSERDKSLFCCVSVCAIRQKAKSRTKRLGRKARFDGVANERLHILSEKYDAETNRRYYDKAARHSQYVMAMALCSVKLVEPGTSDSTRNTAGPSKSRLLGKNFTHQKAFNSFSPANTIAEHVPLDIDSTLAHICKIDRFLGPKNANNTRESGAYNQRVP